MSLCWVVLLMSTASFPPSATSAVLRHVVSQLDRGAVEREHLKQRLIRHGFDSKDGPSICSDDSGHERSQACRIAATVRERQHAHDLHSHHVSITVVQEADRASLILTDDAKLEVAVATSDQINLASLELVQLEGAVIFDRTDGRGNVGGAGHRDSPKLFGAVLMFPALRCDQVGFPKRSWVL
ncbi:MAG: hypothetical protein QG659_532 [Patescibacteria group bacterium]|nr:hypothetical protein [Patescibacteria group bacterium]